MAIPNPSQNPTLSALLEKMNKPRNLNPSSHLDYLDKINRVEFENRKLERNLKEVQVKEYYIII